MKKSYFKAYVKKLGENKYQAIASTDAVDRYGDIVDQSGWELDNYMKNPVMLWAHNGSTDGASLIPVAKATAIDRSQAGKMIVEFEFNTADGSPLAPYIKNSYDNGFLNALSVGFMQNERKGAVITSAELLEISFVPVPANQEALRLAMSKGMELSASFGEIKADIEKALESIKGEVSQEIAVEEAWDQKWEKWAAISDVLNAFWTVYFDHETEVKDFSKLLSETVDLLQKVADSDGADDEKAIKESIQKFVGTRTIKSGTTLNKKSMKAIQKATDYMKAHIGDMGTHIKSVTQHSAALDDVLAQASSEQGSGKSADVTVDENSLIVSLDDLGILRQQLRANDRQNEVAISIVSRFLSTKEAKK